MKSLEQSLLNDALKRNEREWRIVLRANGSGTRSVELRSTIMRRGLAEQIAQEISDLNAEMKFCVEFVPGRFPERDED